MPRQDIADYLELTIETVSRTLNSTREPGGDRLADVQTDSAAQPGDPQAAKLLSVFSLPIP